MSMRLSAPFRSRIRTGTPCAPSAAAKTGVTVETDGHAPESFDQVVSPPMLTRRWLLADADPEEEGRMGQFPFQPNTAILHTDPARDAQASPRLGQLELHVPRIRSAGSPVPGDLLDEPAASFPVPKPSFVSVNPTSDPDPERVLGTFGLRYPVFNAGAHCRAGAGIGVFREGGGSGFAAQWTGYGFHEDGLSSALEVAHASACRVLGRLRESSTAAVNCRPAVPAPATIAEAADGYGLAAAE